MLLTAVSIISMPQIIGCGLPVRILKRLTGPTAIRECLCWVSQTIQFGPVPPHPRPLSLVGETGEYDLGFIPSPEPGSEKVWKSGPTPPFQGGTIWALKTLQICWLVFRPFRKLPHILKRTLL